MHALDQPDAALACQKKVAAIQAKNRQNSDAN
jgi:hypothetical protein